MKTILTIGCSHYLVTSQANASAVLKGLTGSTPLEKGFCSKTRRVIYRPFKGHDENRIGMELVASEQVEFPEKKGRKAKAAKEPTQ